MEGKHVSVENAAVERIFSERKDFIIIGLTGRTGCGCSTVANFLSKKFSELQPPAVSGNDNIDDREYKIVYEYSQDTWTPFLLIEMKHVIFTFILENDFDTTSRFINSIAGKYVDISSLKEEYQRLHIERMKWKKEVETHTSIGENVPADNDIYNFYFKAIPKYYNEFQSAFPVDIYTKLLQKIGDNIRASGYAYSDEITPENILNLSQRVNMLIKILRRRNLSEKKQVLVVIDAFRNPYEATFFKDRYSAFYLFAVNTTDDERRNRLIKKGFTYDSIIELDKKEYPSLDNSIHDFYQINIEKTIELADVHINNKDSESKTYADTKRQLIRYISLIMHPGLVSPTPIERCMQVAYDSKLNSGCLSRQVGAVISDKEYNILSIGWNCAPENQIPCNLRSLFSLTRDDNEDTEGMSEFERTDAKYRDFLRRRVEDIDFSLLRGRNCAYCFKDGYNAYKDQKNQVYTRSIHAEEMAFLQSAKMGNPPVRGGCLFTTASPCELCSKKACHTGISKIYYIDQYPGISYKHILNCGKDSPQMIPFHGAIGRAYTQLYTQILPYKDELYMLLGLTFKVPESIADGL